MLRVCRHAGSITEFAAYNRDCTQTAMDAALHCVNPGVYKLTPPYRDSLVAQDIASGRAAPGGTETAVSLAGDLRAYAPGMPFHQVFDQQGIFGAIHANYGVRPMILQMAHAGAPLLPGEEFGPFGHAIAILGGDDFTNGGGLYYCADGDFPSSLASYLQVYHQAQLLAAQPFCVTVLDVDCGQSYASLQVAILSLLRDRQLAEDGIPGG